MALTQVSASGIKDGSISSSDLADGSISTSKVADDAITADKLNNTGGTAGSYTLSSVTVDAQGRVTAASSGTVPPSIGTRTATASGAISNGAPVIMKSDGNVEAIVSSVSVTTPLTTTNQADSVEANTMAYASAYDKSASRIAYMYRISNNNEIACKTAKISGTSVTYITQYLIASSSGNNWQSVVYDENAERTVFVYVDDYNVLKARVATISASDGTMSFGSLTTLSSNVTKNRIQAVYDEDAQKIVIGCTYNSKPSCFVATVNASNNSISVGSAAQAETSNCGNSGVMMAYDENANKHVIFYRDPSSHLKCKVFVNNGSSGNFYGSDTISASDPARGQAVYDAGAQKIVFYYRDTNDSDKGKAVAVSISANTPTFGTPVTFASQGINAVNAAYDPDAQKTFACACDINADLDCYRATISSGTTLTIESGVEVKDNCGSVSYGVAYDEAANKGFVVWRDPGNGYGGGEILNMSTVTSNLTDSNYIGISNAAYADGATATIQTVGNVDDAQSGLTPGLKYYVQNDGTLASSAASPSVVAGVALSATELLIK